MSPNDCPDGQSLNEQSVCVDDEDSLIDTDDAPNTENQNSGNANSGKLSPSFVEIEKTFETIRQDNTEILLGFKFINKALEKLSELF